METMETKEDDLFARARLLLKERRLIIDAPNCCVSDLRAVRVRKAEESV